MEARVLRANAAEVHADPERAVQPGDCVVVLPADRLMEACRSRGRRLGARLEKLDVAVRDRGAVEFYRELGFEVERRSSDYYGRGRDAWVMKREHPRPA